MDNSRTDVIDVRLEGGPHHLPPAMRFHRASPADDKIKLEYYGGYEHFERVTPDDIDESPVIFRWTGTTRIAE